MRLIIVQILVLAFFVSCQSLEKNPKPCSKTPVDQRFDLKNNSHFFDPGSYWVYKDTISGKLDSLYIIDSKFFDREEDFCSSLISIRSTQIQMFSTYLNSAVFWRFDYSVGPGPNNRLEITEGLNEVCRYYLFHPDHNAVFKKDTIQGKEYLTKEAFQAPYKGDVIWHARNIGIVKKQKRDSSGNVKEDWQLLRYQIVRN